MVNENIDKKAKTITLETDYDFTAFEVHKHRDYFHFDFIKNKNESMGMALFFNRFNGRKYYPKEIKIENVDIDKKTIHLSYS